MKEMTATGITAEIRKLSPRDGDLLVFKVPSPITQDQATMVADVLKNLTVKVHAVFLTPEETLSLALRSMRDEALKTIGLQRIKK